MTRRVTTAILLFSFWCCPIFSADDPAPAKKPLEKINTLEIVGEPVAKAKIEERKQSLETIPKYGIYVKKVNFLAGVGVGGVREKDIITAINNKPIKTNDDLIRVVNSLDTTKDCDVHYSHLERSGNIYEWKRITTKARPIKLDGRKALGDD